jgi:hypothetical protein
MAFQYSTGLKNAVLATGSFKSLLDDGFIKVYSAPTAVPDSPDDALPGDSVLLCTYSDNSGSGGLDFETAAADGVLTKETSQTWSGAGAANGTPAFFRYVKTGDTGTLSTSAYRIQGTVGQAGADMNITNSTYVAGTTYSLDYFSLVFVGG